MFINCNMYYSGATSERQNLGVAANGVTNIRTSTEGRPSYVRYR
jgi:hypothetical protein